jgi:hypothetical protein
MTLVMAFKWLFEEGEAVLMVSDTRATTPFGITFEAKKIHVVALDEKRPLGVIGGAGDPVLVKWGFEVVDEVLKKYAGEDGLVYFNDVRNAVREMEDVFMARFSRLRSEGLDPSSQLILGSLDLDGKASLYQFDSRGLAEPVHDDPGYAIIGSGMITGGVLLLRMFGQQRDIDLGLLTAFILDMVSEVDSSVGPFVGESYLMRLERVGKEKSIALGPLKNEALREYKEKIVKRRGLLQKVWRLCDIVGEEKVLESLDKLEGEAQ